MRKFLTSYIALFFIVCSIRTDAQVLPKNGDTLNYRLVGFSIPKQDKVTEYEFEIFVAEAGSGHSIELPVVKKKVKTNTLIETLPHFNKMYSWKVNYYVKGKPAGSSDKRQFFTGYSKFIDSSRYRLRVTQNNLARNDLYIFADASRALYDLNGEPIWYLPDIPGVLDENSTVRDLKLTPQHTITFMTERNIYETDYDGNVLWRGPNSGAVNGDKTERYHHEFTRLESGNYMVCGNEIYMIPLPNNQPQDSWKHLRTKTIDGTRYIITECGTLIEYNPAGDVVWQWKSSAMFGDSFLLKANTGPRGQIDTRTHMNGFYFNEKNKTIYISFRDISSIVKIDYPSGLVLAAYGKYGYTGEESFEPQFYGQHTCRVNRDGDLYFFNNNAVRNPDPNKVSSIIYAAEPKDGNGKLNIKWEFSCDIDTITRPVSGGGGSVFELEDGTVLTTMGSVNRLFIVSKKQNILWNSFIEARLIKDWQEISNYRCSALERRRGLERLIFGQ